MRCRLDAGKRVAGCRAWVQAVGRWGAGCRVRGVQRAVWDVVRGLWFVVSGQIFVCVCAWRHVRMRMCASSAYAYECLHAHTKICPYTPTQQICPYTTRAHACVPPWRYRVATALLYSDSPCGTGRPLRDQTFLGISRSLSSMHVGCLCSGFAHSSLQ